MKLIILCTIGWIVLSTFFSCFIVFFDRRKIFNVRHGFAYILLFFAAGISMLLYGLMIR